MIEPDPIGNDAREAEHLRKLGPPPHICLFCGIDDPIVLLRKTLAWLQARVPPRLLEEHHVGGENHDPNLTVLLCRTCHWKVTAGYFRAGIDMRYEPDEQKRRWRKQQARGAFLIALGEDMVEESTTQLKEIGNDRT